MLPFVAIVLTWDTLRISIKSDSKQNVKEITSQLARIVRALDILLISFS